MYGLSKKFASQDEDLILIMDADGEDSPSDVSRLLDKIENENLSLVTAQRGSRNTTFFFKIGYLFFQISGKILTGKTINHGTFSISKDQNFPVG